MKFSVGLFLNRFTGYRYFNVIFLAVIHWALNADTGNCKIVMDGSETGGSYRHVESRERLRNGGVTIGSPRGYPGSLVVYYFQGYCSMYSKLKVKFRCLAVKGNAIPHNGPS